MWRGSLSYRATRTAAPWLKTVWSGLTQAAATARMPCPTDKEETVSRITSSVPSHRTSRLDRHTQRAARRRLEREVLELASTPSGRSELAAVMRRHTEEENAELEAILTRTAC